MINTKDKPKIPLTKADKIEALKETHLPAFKKLGIQDPLFIPKMFFGEPKVFYLFPSELKHGKDIYTEAVSKEYESEDPSRTLYKWKFNPNFETDYPKKAFGHQTDMMCIVPFTELTVIETHEDDDIAKEFDLSKLSGVEDLPISQMTIRDFTAIMTGKPVSLKGWLNEIIIRK